VEGFVNDDKWYKWYIEPATSGNSGAVGDEMEFAELGCT